MATTSAFQPPFNIAFRADTDDTAGAAATGCVAWPITWPCDTTDAGPAAADEAHRLAEALLAGVAGIRVGICQHVDGYWPRSNGTCGVPYKDAAGNWRNGGGRGGDCCRLLLEHGPVIEVVKVAEFGVDLDPGEYALEGSWLRRNGACWPAADNCEAAPVTVTYRTGVGFPAGTAAAVGEVACEILEAIGGRPCKLPSRAVRITRQGVTVDLQAAGDGPGLGLPISDAWLKSINPANLHARSRVLSPDLPRGAPLR